jgi:hypothetical protein
MVDEDITTSFRSNEPKTIRKKEKESLSLILIGRELKPVLTGARCPW